MIELNKAVLKNFPIYAREELISKIRIKAEQLGITAEGIREEKIILSDAVFIEGRQLTLEEEAQRRELIDEINRKGYKQVIEEVAYTWFNRFVALRFMEVNDFLPIKVRVLSSKDKSYEPDIIKEALNIDLDLDRELIYRMRTSSENTATDRLYKYLIIKLCNRLNEILPLMFEKIDDYTEILFPDGLLSEGSFLRIMTDTRLIPESAWENVEIVGWLYQYYISQKKAQVFDKLRKGEKIEKEDIPPATQLFTPNWIVRYLVENSLGKLWQEAHPNEELKKGWKYYIEGEEQEEEVAEVLEKLKREKRNIKVEDIKIIDPAMGSGHILLYAFDLLYDIYLAEGYMEREIPKLILEKNLYGIDIDKRAFQLAYFSLMMKGRSKNKRFFNEKLDLNIMAIEESNDFPREALEYFCQSNTYLDREEIKRDLEYLLDIFTDAGEFGSILKVENINYQLIENRLEEIRNTRAKDMFELQYRDVILKKLPKLIKQARILGGKYDVMVTNPPYMASKGMNYKLSNFVKREYPDTKGDLFAVFMELDEQLVKENGFMAMINQHSWMFLATFERYRERLLENRTIDSMLHLGPKAFEEIGGEVVQSTAFVIRKIRLKDYRGVYIRLVDYNKADFKEKKALEAITNSSIRDKYIVKGDNFRKIPGSPIAYWLHDNAIKAFSGPKLGDYVRARIGLITGDNNRFLRYWYEVNMEKIGFNILSIEDSINSKKKWFPYQKGGPFRKWYGNIEYIVNWENDGYEMKFDNSIKGRVRSHNYNGDFSFKRGITWSTVTTGPFSCRYSPAGFMFDAAGPLCKVNDDDYLYMILGFLSSKLAMEFLTVLNPTMNMHPGYIHSLPFDIDKCLPYKDQIDRLVMENINISKADWDSFERSWDFKAHPLVQGQLKGDHGKLRRKYKTIEEAFNNWLQIADETFNKLKANEVELNRIFIRIYGLEGVLTPEVEDKDITISKLVERKEKERKNPYTIDRKEAIESFISYAIGCIFGRYSLDYDGIAYAGGDFDINKYKIFPVLEDNILPVTPTPYFKDDLVSRFIDFVRLVFGEEDLDKNIKYIADSIGIKGNETPQDTLRRYFIKDFYKYHVKAYNKRPIYWLFRSGKRKAFNAFIYIHRYDSTTLARLRTDYIHVLQSKLYIERDRLLENIRDESLTKSERRRYQRELENIDRDMEELIGYDEILHNMADKMIEMDLDQGIRENYKLFSNLLQNI